MSHCAPSLPVHEKRSCRGRHRHVPRGDAGGRVRPGRYPVYGGQTVRYLIAAVIWLVVIRALGLRFVRLDVARDAAARRPDAARAGALQPVRDRVDPHLRARAGRDRTGHRAARPGAARRPSSAPAADRRGGRGGRRDAGHWARQRRPARPAVVAGRAGGRGQLLDAGHPAAAGSWGRSGCRRTRRCWPSRCWPRSAWSRRAPACSRRRPRRRRSAWPTWRPW